MSQTIIAEATRIARTEANKAFLAARHLYTQSQIPTEGFNWERVAVRIAATWIIGVIFYLAVGSYFATKLSATRAYANNLAAAAGLKQLVGSQLTGAVLVFIAKLTPVGGVIFPLLGISPEAIAAINTGSQAPPPADVQKELDSLGITDKILAFTLQNLTIILSLISLYWLYAEYSRIQKRREQNAKAS